MLKSEASPIFRAVRPWRGLAPKPLGPGNSLRQPAIVVLSFLSVGTWCRKNLFFCFGGPTEGFASFSGFVSIHVFPYVSGGGYCSVLLSSQVLLGGGVCSGFEEVDFFP